MYSQNNEDDNLIKILPKEGVLIEIGAFDGKIASNSLLLIERGWRAFLVEPSPIAFSKIVTLHGNNKNVDLLNCAILPNSEEEKNKFKIIKFYESEMSLISTTSKEFSENDYVKEGNRWNNPPYKKILTTGIEIDVILERVVEKWNRIDFLSIDAEGISSDIVMSIDFNRYNIKCLCVEVGKNIEKEHSYLQNFGYKIVQRTHENLILLK